jgi:hypothetical protein
MVVMRQIGLSIGLVAFVTLASATSADAHHGFNGRYDRAHPLYLEGVVTQATYNLPHGLITVQPSEPTVPPADLRALSSGDYTRLGGQDVVLRAQPILATGGGLLTLLLPPPMTTTAAELAAPPSRGQSVGAIVFRECSTGELRVQLLRISATARIVRTGVIQREVDGCESEAASTQSVAPASTPSPVAAAPSAANEPVGVPTRPQADTFSALQLVAMAVVAGGAALALGLFLARRGVR